jgi:hypothetical protein
MDTPLTSFTPLGNKARIGLSPKALLLIFLLLSTSLSEAWLPRNSPFAFLLGWRTFPGAGEADSVKPCPTMGGHPKGLVLGKIPQVDYTPNEPAGETPLRESA